MILEIVKYPDKRLKERSFPVTEFGDELDELIRNLFETMYENNGVGLSAVQVGVMKRVFVMDAREEDGPKDPVACVNPRIISTNKKRVQGKEGCLSIPGFFTQVSRWETIQVTNEVRRPVRFLVGLESKIFQHELDHLNGLLINDRPNGAIGGLR